MHRKCSRITEYLDLDFKTYRCEMMFGKTTDTQDIWGEIIEEKDTKNLDEESIRDAFSEVQRIDRAGTAYV